MPKMMECHPYDYISLFKTLFCQAAEKESLGGLKEANGNIINCIWNHMVETRGLPLGNEGNVQSTAIKKQGPESYTYKEILPTT